MSESTGPPAAVMGTATHLLHSDVVDDDYELMVWCPPGSYEDSDERFPVLYVLDAPTVFGFAATTVLAYVVDGLVPQMYVVGIGAPHADWSTWGPIRDRDYASRPMEGRAGSGEAARFMQALQTEILPFVDRTYRTDPGDRLAWGHSQGASFLFNVLGSVGPTLFGRCLATSPSVHSEGAVMIDPDSDLPAAGTSLPARVFVAYGADDDEYGPEAATLVATLADRAYEGFELTAVELPGRGHIATAVDGFIAGLLALTRDRTAGRS